MKTISTLYLLLLSSLLFSQADTWEPIVTDGLMNSDLIGVIEFVEFKGELYAGTQHKTVPGAAELWKSSTGQAGTWSIVDFDPGNMGIKGIVSVFADTIDGGYLWIGVSDGLNGTGVYRTSDGTTWTQINYGGFLESDNRVPTPNMLLFQGPTDTTKYLYAGAGSHGGSYPGEIWRLPYSSTNPNDWERVMDFDSIDSTITQITYFYEFQNKLYFGTNGVPGGTIYESTDGVNFTVNSGWENYKEPTCIAVACFIEFQDSLYITTTNKITGGKMYRTKDGDIWTPITTDGFGEGSDAEELHNLDTTGGFIWVTAYTDTSGGLASPIWRSSDGISFIQSNSDGFGNPENTGENAVTIGFQGHQYHGGPNYNDGAQIWRTETPTSLVEIDHCGISKITRSGDLLHFQFESSCTEPESIQIFDLAGKLIENRGANYSSIEISLKGISGIYIYRILFADGMTYSGKISIQ